MNAFWESDISIRYQFCSLTKRSIFWLLHGSDPPRAGWQYWTGFNRLPFKHSFFFINVYRDQEIDTYHSVRQPVCSGWIHNRQWRQSTRVLEHPHKLHFMGWISLIDEGYVNYKRWYQCHPILNHWISQDGSDYKQNPLDSILMKM